ncbi:MAG: BsuPI-related putative proteinase inhibitor [Halobacteriales archaeon]|nr:BsuPI-related putative proteinase inhibitor [Halobacteriales archaeon]
MDIAGTLHVTTRDGEVDFAFTVSNESTEIVELDFTTGFIADFAVFADDTEVWRWSDDRLFTQELTTETLEPGESFQETALWIDPDPGDYRAVAELQTRTYDLTAEDTFVV